MTNKATEQRDALHPEYVLNVSGATQAAANKAAEEGGRPTDDEEISIGSSDFFKLLISLEHEPCLEKRMNVAEFVDTHIDKLLNDRASRQVEVRTTDRNYAEGSPHNICRAIERDLREELARQVANKAEVECRDDGLCQYAIDRGAGGNGPCAKGQCCMPRAVVGNKAEVEPVAWMRENGRECITVACKKTMENAGFGVWHEVAATYTIPLYATPPATTGSSTVLTDGRKRDMFEAWADEAGYPTRRGFGNDNDYDFVETRRMWESWQACAEVAAQAGQVAVPEDAGQPMIGKLLDQFSELPVLWGLNEPGALVRHGDVFKMLVTVGKEYAPSPAKESK